jgi:pimeloyl-ACP methyl ester carboxylesterase
MVILLAGVLKKRYCLATVLALITAFVLWYPVLADGPGDSPTQDDGRRVGLVSTAAECMVVQSGIPDSVSATVRLEWEGRIEKAFLVLSAAGSEGGHSIYVNGQRVGSAPVRPDDLPCQAGSPATILAPTDEIPIPVEVLAKGENVITLTNDADINDGWTAINLHLEVHGVLSGPPVALLEDPSLAMASPPDITSQDIGAMAVISDSAVLASSYDGVPQVIWYQIPYSYTGSPTPLLIGTHGYSGTGEGTRAYLAAGANERGWLLAAPDMHGQGYPNTGKYAFAWPGAQHDVIDTIEYMMTYYNVDTSRIYIVGGSMGGQAVTVMAAKYPDVFAAAAGWKPITHLASWYAELNQDFSRFSWALKKLREETDPGCDPDIDTNYDTGCGTPPVVPFAYQRRSAREMPQNDRLIPLKMWHDVQDELVVVSHSVELKEAIDNWRTPTTLVPLDRVDTGDEPDNLCDAIGDSYRHCYSPPPLENSFWPTITLTVDSQPVGYLFDFLESYTSTLHSQPPPSLTIRTDESKPYYWLNVAQTGGDHWSEVETAYGLANRTVTATISDTQPLTLGFNLGSMPIVGSAGITQSGMGLPVTTYLIKGGGIYTLTNYISGYLTTTLASTGQFALTISAIEAEVLANPSIVSTGQTSTITAIVRDHLSNPVPDGITIEFSTTAGTFPNASSTYPTTVTGGQGQATAILTTDGPAQVIASVGSITASTSINAGYRIYLPVVIKNN